MDGGRLRRPPLINYQYYIKKSSKYIGKYVKICKHMQKYTKYVKICKNHLRHLYKFLLGGPPGTQGHLGVPKGPLGPQGYPT